MGGKGGQMVACVAGGILVTGVTFLGGGPPREAGGQSREISIGLVAPSRGSVAKNTTEVAR